MQEWGEIQRSKGTDVPNLDWLVEGNPTRENSLGDCGEYHAHFLPCDGDGVLFVRRFRDRITGVRSHALIICT